MDTTTPTATPAATATATDEQRIRALVARSEEAQFDAAVLPELHTAETVIVNSGGRRLFGRDAFSRPWRRRSPPRSRTSGPRWRSTTSGSPPRTSRS
jgi:hypothetical protein